MGRLTLCLCLIALGLAPAAPATSATTSAPDAPRVSLVQRAVTEEPGVRPKRLGEPGLVLAGAGEHIWAVVPVADGGREDAGADGAWLAHHGPGDDQDRVAPALELAGGITAAVALGDAVWLTYAHGGVQRVAASRSEVDGTWRYGSRIEAPLPAHERVLGLASEGGRVWALLDGAALPAGAVEGEGRDAEASPGMTREQMLESLRLGLPPNMPPPGSGRASAGLPRRGAGGEIGLVLVALEGARWRHRALPNGLVGAAAIGLLADDGGGGVTLLAVEGRTLSVYAREAGDADEAWRSSEHELAAGVAAALGRGGGGGGGGDAAVAMVGGRIVLGWVDAGDEDSGGGRGGSPAVELARLGAGDAPIELLGRVNLVGVERGAWGLTAAERDARPAVVVAGAAEAGLTDRPAPSGDAALVWSWVGLDGEVIAPGQAVRWREAAAGYAVDHAIMIAVLIVALLTMFIFWRRDLASQRLTLPATLVLAPLGRRAAAGVIDLAGPMAIVMVIYGLGLDEVPQRWPGQGTASSWRTIEPGVLIIALFLLHVTVAELATRRTLGKWAMGLEVRGLDGTRPRAWQLLTRNALKALDLVVWLLLLLVLLGPFRQRLGDLAARTVVAAPKPEEPKAQDEDAGGDEGEA